MAARILVVIGTRPEAIKLAPVVLALRDSPTFEPFVVVTGQHREMVDQMLALFGIQADRDLNLMRGGQALGELTGRVLAGVEAVIAETVPDVVVVQGDTTTAMAGALAAFYQRVPVVHLEAGLRTNERYSPYPEEINRRLITQLASLHLAPTDAARDNLLRDGVDPATIHVTGNTVIDALFRAIEARLPYDGEHARQLTVLEQADVPVLLVTAHRRESWESGLADIAEALVELANLRPRLRIVFPIHRNAVVRDAILPIVADHPRILMIEPLDYGRFVRLLRRADVVLTDSGGIQEEAVSLGKPTLVARETTERPEAVAAGGTRLVGTEPVRIVLEVLRLLDDPLAYEALVCRTLPFGDGNAAERTMTALAGLVAAERVTSRPAEQLAHA